jgi:hypothetical protein
MVAEKEKTHCRFQQWVLKKLIKRFGLLYFHSTAGAPRPLDGTMGTNDAAKHAHGMH